MSKTRTEVFAELLDFGRSETLLAAAAVPEGARFVQVRSGKATPLWLVGHLANAANMVFLVWLLGKPSILSESFARKFAPDLADGDPITTDPGDYPAWEAVVAEYDRVMQNMVAVVKAELDDDTLATPPRGPMPDRVRDRLHNIEATLQRLINHDAYHRGQIGLLGKLG